MKNGLYEDFEEIKLSSPNSIYEAKEVYIALMAYMELGQLYDKEKVYEIEQDILMPIII